MQATLDYQRSVTRLISKETYLGFIDKNIGLNICYPLYEY